MLGSNAKFWTHNEEIRRPVQGRGIEGLSTGKAELSFAVGVRMGVVPCWIVAGYNSYWLCDSTAKKASKAISWAGAQ